jgi:protein ImuA
MLAVASLSPETIHPSLWRGSQLARASSRCVDAGYAALNDELPGGWPQGALTDLLLQQPGVGELRLLVPALRQLGTRPTLLIQPPHALQPVALANWGVDASRLIMLRAPKLADALWATEQALRAGSCGAVLLWQSHVRSDALRRLHLAAQTGEALFFLFRPLAAARETSPAPLRLSLIAAKDGISITFVKRRGPQRDEPLFVPLSPSPVLLSRHATLDRRTSAAPRPRVVSPALANVIS